MSAEFIGLLPQLATDNIVPKAEGSLGALQIVALVLCFVIPLIGWAMLFRQVLRFVKHYKVGAPDPNRTNNAGSRTATLLKEFFGHTRMSRLPIVAIAHWFTALSFFILFTTLVNAFFQLVQPNYRLPIIGHFAPFEWVIEFFAVTGFVGIIILILARQKAHPRSAAGKDGRRSRFFGSTWWQAYYVEFTIFMVCLCIFLLRTLEAAMVKIDEPSTSIPMHFPLTGWAAGIWGDDRGFIANMVYLIAMIKILVSFAWMITISLQPTMGVAWHRFLAFPNIWFKRESSGRTALGNLRPMTMGGGKPFSLEAMEEAAEDEDAEEPVLGVGKVEDFSWKGLLDFSTCTECGRCQSQCPAWNTDKPLSPKLLMMTLRDHANAKTPWLLAADDAARDKLSEDTKAAAAVPALVGATGYDIESPLSAYNPHGPDAVIDEDVLWSCTTCGACVEQCPVDIEHVDHIVDMRRYQALIESAFPAELGGLFKNLEKNSNPWGMSPKIRMDWAKGLDFEVPVVGKDVEDLSQVDYLFWVGCAGAFEDRAKKTTRAVAELLDTAGVKFAVLGDGEACTGDSARRAGNEVLFQMLAQQNIEMLNEAGATKIVVTCAHCFNTIKNEYPELGGKYEVLHHTQLLNRLVREKKLVPVGRPEERPGKSTAKDASSTAGSVTYHDPCYLGRHNHVYAPPRELIGALPGVELKEMPRHGEKSFCCGAGGARMWMEEKLGSRINLNRTEEAIATGAERIAIGCPFCRVMLTDGLTAKQSEGASEEIEVVDVAQMLLAAVRREGRPVEEAKAAPKDDAKDEVAEAKKAEKSDGGASKAKVAGAAAAGGAAAAAAAGATEDATDKDVEAQRSESASAEAKAGQSEAAQADDGDPWDDTPAAPAAKAAPAAAADDDADPWDDAPAAPAAKAAPAAAADEDADPWDDAPAAPAAKAAPAAAAADDDADPWDEPGTASAAPKTEAAPATEEKAAPAAASADADPWDEPDPWDDAPAASSKPAPAAEAKPEEAPKAEAPAEEPKAEAAPAAPATAAAGADDVDPWDLPDGEEPTPAPATAAPAPVKDEAPAAQDEAPKAEAPQAEAGTTEAPKAEPAAEAPKAAAPAATTAPATDDVDPWDLPDDAELPTPAQAPAAQAPATEAPATPTPVEESAPEAPAQSEAPQAEAEAPVEEAPQAEAPAEEPKADEPQAEAPAEAPAPEQPKAEAPKPSAGGTTVAPAGEDDADPWD